VQVVAMDKALAVVQVVAMDKASDKVQVVDMGKASAVVQVVEQASDKVHSQVVASAAGRNGIAVVELDMVRARAVINGAIKEDRTGIVVVELDKVPVIQAVVQLAKVSVSMTVMRAVTTTTMAIATMNTQASVVVPIPMVHDRRLTSFHHYRLDCSCSSLAIVAFLHMFNENDIFRLWPKSNVDSVTNNIFPLNIFELTRKFIDDESTSDMHIETACYTDL